jgi:predicted RNase H-like nuclease (RuvC/YqgF family)
VIEQAPEQKLEVVKRPQEYYTMREENKVLKQCIKISKDKISELEEKLRKLKREDDRIYDIYDMLKQRCPMGKEEELYNRLNRMLNGNDL